MNDMIKTARKERNLTQEELGKLVGVQKAQISKLLTAQKDFRPGYVINLKNDTLIGDIDYRGDKLMSQLCVFKPQHLDKEVKYSPSDIKAYRFKDDRFFVSREVNGKQVFLEFLIKGKISMYYFRDKTGDHFFIEKEGTKLTELTYVEKILADTAKLYQYEYTRVGWIHNDKMYQYESTLHIGILNYYMQDVPKLKSRIEDMKKPKHNTLINLAKDYHNAVCKDESCIIYQKKVPLIKVNLTGILYSTVNVNNINTPIFRFPFQIEYIYPKGRFVPKIAFGINVYKPLAHIKSLMAGFNYKINNKTDLVFNYDIGVAKLFIKPKKLFSQTFQTGISMHL